MTTDPATAFDAMAASYDELEPWSEHLYAVLHGLLRASLGPATGTRIRRALDAGCGTGLQTAILLELGYETIGLDLSARLLAVARRRHPAARFARADVQALPWPAGTFDAVLSFVPHPARAIGEMARVLRPGGQLFLEVEHRWSLDLVRLGRATGALYRGLRTLDRAVAATGLGRGLANSLVILAARTSLGGGRPTAVPSPLA